MIVHGGRDGLLKTFFSPPFVPGSIFSLRFCDRICFALFYAVRIKNCLSSVCVCWWSVVYLVECVFQQVVLRSTAALGGIGRAL